jgi:hypothetical protein
MKIKTKDRANLIRLTFFDLNKKGVVLAGLLLGGLIFLGGVFWHALQDNRHEPQKLSKTSGPFLPLTTPELYNISREHTSDVEKEVELEYYEKNLLDKICYDEFFIKLFRNDQYYSSNPRKYFKLGGRLAPYTSSDLKYFLELDYSLLPSRLKIKKRVNEVHQAKINAFRQWQKDSQKVKSKPGKAINPNGFNESYTLGTTPSDKIKAILDRQEYQAAYQKEIENNKSEELRRQLIKDYEEYKISTFPKLDKEELPEGKESGFLGFLETWWDGAYGDIKRRDKEKEYRRRKSMGLEK